MARGLCYKWRDTIGKTPVSSRCRRASITTSGRARRRSAVHEEPLPLQLALVLGHRQRRPRQPGHPRNGHRPLGPGRDAPDEGQRHRRQVHVRRRPGDAEHAVSASYEFDVDGKKKMMTFEVRHWISPHEAGINGEQAGQHHRQPVLRLEGLPGHRQLQQVLLVPGQGPDSRDRRRPRGDEHWANFIDAVRSRKREDLNAEIEEGALSCNLMHLANISYRLGRTLHWDAEDDDVRRRRRGEQDADARLSRAVRGAEGPDVESAVSC